MFYEGEEGECCFDDILEESDIDGYQTMMNILILVSALLVTLCTVYLCFKLLRVANRPHIANSRATNRARQRSAVIIILICIIFILSELIEISETLNSSRLLPSFSEEIEAFGDAFNDLSLNIGFTLNFLVYLIMSEQFRHMLKEYF